MWVGDVRRWGMVRVGRGRGESGVWGTVGRRACTYARASLFFNTPFPFHPSHTFQPLSPFPPPSSLAEALGPLRLGRGFAYARVPKLSVSIHASRLIVRREGSGSQKVDRRQNPRSLVKNVWNG